MDYFKDNGICSYLGFLTLNSKRESNIFIFIFPTASTLNEIPVTKHEPFINGRLNELMLVFESSSRDCNFKSYLNSRVRCYPN